MKNIMIALGVMLTSVIVLAIPILFVCSIYESWPQFITVLLFLSMIVDFSAVSFGVVNLVDDFE